MVPKISVFSINSVKNINGKRDGIILEINIETLFFTFSKLSFENISNTESNIQKITIFNIFFSL